jgi:RNA polymerase sigma-70 factor (ECF subfamily)
MEQVQHVKPTQEPIADYRHASDEQLLTAARSSDGHAFVELSGRHADRLRKTVFRIVRNHEDTEDVTQDALFKAYVHLSDFRASSSFSTWLIKIGINCAFMLLRKRRSTFKISFDQWQDEDQSWDVWEFADPSPSAEQVYSKRQALELLLGEVNRLPLLYRSVLEQYHFRERSLQDVANAVGISVAAAKSRLLRARLNIRSALERKRISAAGRTISQHNATQRERVNEV